MTTPKLYFSLHALVEALALLHAEAQSGIKKLGETLKKNLLPYLVHLLS